MPPRSRIAAIVQAAAANFTAGRPPEPSDEDALYIEEHPEAVGEVFDILAAEMGRKKGRNQSRFLACTWLLTVQLELIRNDAELGRVWARDLLEATQERLATAMRAGKHDPAEWHEVLSTFRSAKVPLSAAVRGAFLGVEDPDGADIDPSVREEALGSLRPLVAEMVGAGLEDPFDLADGLAEILDGIYPPIIKCLLAEDMARTMSGPAQEAVVLLLLDPEVLVRRKVAELLGDMAGRGTLSPVSWRRLSALVAWLPEDERAALAPVLDQARAAKPAAWPAAEVATSFVSIVDGDGRQNLGMAGGRRGRSTFAMLRFRQGEGFDEAICSFPVPHEEAQDMVTMAGEELGLMRVNDVYVDRVIGHGLALAAAQGRPGPLAVFRLAEILGRAHWRPQRLDPAGELAALPPELADDEATTDSLDRSGDWPVEEEFPEEWLRTDAEIDGVLEAMCEEGAKLEEGVAALLAGPLNARRQMWAERFLLCGLAVRASTPPNESVSWTDFLVLAREVASDRPLDEIPLMEWIAEGMLEESLDV